MTSETTRLKLALNILVLSLSLYGISQKNFLSDEPSLFESMVINTFAPIQRGIVSARQRVSYIFNNYFFLVDAAKENKHLREEVHRLETEVFNLGEIALENKRLKKLLNFGTDIPARKVMAQVVSWDPASNFKVVRINKGLDDGIKLQSTVVTSQGLVGYVYRATSKFSDVLTILDQNSRIDAIISGTRTHGILEGYTDIRCVMKYVIRTEPVVLSDVVVTSGLSNIYPKGLIIGKVSKIERESFGITQLIEISPAVNFNKLEEVAVLVFDGPVNPELKEEVPLLDIMVEKKAKKKVENINTPKTTKEVVP